MNDEGGMMNERQEAFSFSFILHPSAFIIAFLKETPRRGRIVDEREP
jgi:hypothetical protein